MGGEKEPEQEERCISFITKLRTQTADNSMQIRGSIKIKIYNRQTGTKP